MTGSSSSNDEQPGTDTAPEESSDALPGTEERTGRFNLVPLRVLLPNIITLLALCSGVTAIRLGIEGRFELAVAAIILACVLDAIDGRLARFLKGATKFGAELDSLADFVNFGVAPGVLIFLWSLQDLKNLGWVVALALAICMALRLARFNVALDEPNKPAWKAEFFTGIPAPAGAFLAMAPMYLGFLGIIEDGRAVAAGVLPWVVLVSAGMVSSIPTFSGKAIGLKVRRDKALLIVVATVFSVAMLVSYPWMVLTLFSVVYVAMIPLARASYKKHEREWLAQQADQKK